MTKIALLGIAAVVASCSFASAAPGTMSAAPHTMSAAPGTMSAPNTTARSQTCTATFNSNKARIESLAKNGDSSGIQSIFASSGCPGVGVSLAKQSGDMAKAQKVTCVWKLIPPSVTCTFGMATVPQNQSY